MAFAILGTPKPAFFDSSGSPLTSGTLAVLDPADDTNKASYPTYDDAEAATNANVNPVVLDARGEPPNGLWGLDNEDYKLVLKDSAGATIWTTDDVFLPAMGQYYAETTQETANGVTPVDTSYEPGHAFRYLTTAQIADVIARGGAEDVTSGIQSALDSGHKAYLPEGTYAIEGTLTMLGAGATGGPTLEMTSGTRLERFTSATVPILHIYGVQNNVEGNGAQIASRTYGYPYGMILVGGNPDNAYTTVDNIATQHNNISDLKLIGSSTTMATATSP